MDGRELMQEETEIMPPAPDFDPQEWEDKRREQAEAEIAPFKALRNQINEHDELMAETLYEVTMLELGESEV